MKSPKHPKDYPLLVPVKDTFYHVVFFKRLSNNDLGFCDYDGKIIGLSREQSGLEMYATFFHELFHAFSHEYKIPLGHPQINRMEWDMVAILHQFPIPKKSARKKK
jgi:hypothetical protein